MFVVPPLEVCLTGLTGSSTRTSVNYRVPKTKKGHIKCVQNRRNGIRENASKFDFDAENGKQKSINHGGTFVFLMGFSAYHISILTLSKPNHIFSHIKVFAQNKAAARG